MSAKPKKRKRPSDVIGNAVHVMRIATEQIEEEPVIANTMAVEMGQ